MKASDIVQPPTPPTRKFMRYVLGFMVGTIAGLGPFLGTVGVPGFKALIELLPQFPADLKSSVIPASAFLMGLVVVVLQFLSKQSIPRIALRRGFLACLVVLLAAFVVLYTLSAIFVQEAEIEGVPTTRVMISWFREPDCCPGVQKTAVTECLGGRSWDPKLYRKCWGDGRLTVVKSGLSLAYLVLTVGTGVLVGLLILYERNGPRRRRSPARRHPGLETKQPSGDTEKGSPATEPKAAPPVSPPPDGTGPP